MSQVQQLLESAASGWKNMQSDAARLAAKWEVTGLLEGLRSETDKNNMSLILENQAKQLVVEQSSVGGGSGYGAFSVGQGAEWAGIALPLVRKVFGQIAAKEFVSVQPMNLPSGLVFYLDFQYGTGKTPFAVGNSLYGNTGSEYPFATPAAEGGLYGTGRFTYSTNQFSASVAVTSSATQAGPSAVTAGQGLIVSASTLAEINQNSDYSASLAAGELYKLTISASSLSGFDQDAVRGFFAASGSNFPSGSSNKVIPQFTSYNYTAGTITFILTSSANFAVIDDASTFVVEYNKATSMNEYNVGDFEAGNAYAVPNAESSTEIVIPEININMRSEAITAKTKKLKAVWTPEFAQDLNAYQALDAEAEVTNIMSEYISLEIDLEILDMLIEDAAAGTEYWSVQNNNVYNPATQTFAAGSNNLFYNTQGQWFQTLGTKMQKLSNKIHQLTLRGGANFMVVSPSVATIIESIPGFASNSDGSADKMEYAFGVQKAGQLNSRYTVYKNPYMTENVILMGFRGSQFLEAGAVFAPYIPLIMTPLIYDPTTFTPRKGLLTRYAKKMLRPEFYGKIYISNLNVL